MKTNTYTRGDMYYANFSPIIGSEQSGYRPCIIIQNNFGNEHSPTVIVCAVTSKGLSKTKLPVHVELPGELGLGGNSIALLEQIRTVDKRRLKGYIGKLNDDTMREIDEALAVSVNLQNNTYDEGILMTLCGKCANTFFTSNEHRIRKANQKQGTKEPCMICTSKNGYDYIVQKKAVTHNKENSGNNKDDDNESGDINGENAKDS